MKDDVRKVYLTGPVRMVRSKTARKMGNWRKDAAAALAREGLECLQGGLETRADRDTGFPRELGLIRECDVVLANMWKPSIGTTLSIVRARQRGKPVVLRMSDSVRSPMLKAIVGAENVMPTMVAAARRVVEVLREEQELKHLDLSALVEGAGTAAVTKMIAQAALAADEADVGLEATIVNAFVPLLGVVQPCRGVDTKQAVSDHLLVALSQLERGAFDDQAAASYRRVRKTLKRQLSGAAGADESEALHANSREDAAFRQSKARERVIWQALLPRLKFHRDSEAHLARLGPERQSILAILRQLDGGGVPPGTKPFRATQWWECHYLEDGRPTGRIYWQRYGDAVRVLVSTKSTQNSTDFEYLRDHKRPSGTS